ncbi:TOMM precursor leader peptide-binding protein [Micromonospora sp. WMMA1363]|uniref:TOMM precursor leader peptide-binding protein n=1 Tax=Micromonospora sp. WMMA1363 TaxID=3053985 RepID=UPI00259CB494|nr:TOMM precursor leader peptide-binding protein [Micromonospora sp. WMMA1363]MDM4718718.1 TOMM precursor leader peptide-binding protein [Micromonospora sp. WMMA1363]
MSTAYDAVAQTRPRVRHDVLFTRTEDGVVFHNANSGFRFSSATAYRLASLLVPHLNGRNQVADICARLPAGQRAMIGELVSALYARGFARDIPEAEGDPAAILGPAVATHFATQVAYLDHYTDRAPQRFAAFRATSVTVLGAGPVAIACATGLLRNGAATVTVSPAILPTLAPELAELDAAGCAATTVALPAADGEVGWADLATAEIVVVAAGGDAPRATLRLLEAGIPADRLLLPAWVAGGRMLVGPVQGAGRTGCWCCAMLRLGDNDETGATGQVWQAAALPSGAVPGTPELDGPLAAMVGNLLAYEVFRLTTGALPAETDGSVIVQHLASLDVLTEPLLPHPRCPFCQPRAPEPAWTAVELDGAVVGADEPTDQSALAEATLAQLTAHQQLLQPHLGVFRRYDDERWDQTPIKIGTVEFTDGSGRRRTVSAFDVHHVAAARLRALRVAAVSATGHTAVGAVAADGAPRVGAVRLGLASGWGDTAADVWAAARSLLTGEAAAVPAAVLEPFGAANHRRGAEPTSAGGGAGGDLAEAVRSGLASAFAGHALRQVVAGRVTARRIRLDAIGADPELVFLTKAATNLGVAVELLDLGGQPDTGVTALLARSFDPTRGQWSFGLAADPAWTVAAVAALRDVLGQAQLRAQDPGAVPDIGDPVLVDFDAGTVPVHGEADTAAGLVHRWADVLDRLREHGCDVLVAPVGGPDLAAGGLVAVKVLLAVGDLR